MAGPASGKKMPDAVQLSPIALKSACKNNRRRAKLQLIRLSRNNGPRRNNEQYISDPLWGRVRAAFEGLSHPPDAGDGC